MTQFACGLSIGEVSLPNRAFLAPMAGITDRPLRDLAARFGAGMVVSEMIASAAFGTGQRQMVQKATRSAGLPHVVQLAGCQGDELARAAAILADGGAQMIDLNLGCPAKRVTGGFAGSALMRVPDQALRLIEATVGATDLPVTVKMRLGWDEERLNAPEIARLAEGAGARMITVHGRTRQQFYKGRADWDRVADVVRAVSIPVVVNGDIVSTETAREALARSGAAAVMIGRGAQGRPWLVGRIGAELAGRAAPTAPQGMALAELVAGHYEAMLGDYGTEIGVRVARKHLGWYVDGLDGGDPALKRRLLTEERPEAVLGLLPLLAQTAWSRAA